jgi:hypothetical protein
MTRRLVPLAVLQVFQHSPSVLEIVLPLPPGPPYLRTKRFAKSSGWEAGMPLIESFSLLSVCLWPIDGHPSGARQVPPPPPAERYIEIAWIGERRVPSSIGIHLLHASVYNLLPPHADVPEFVDTHPEGMPSVGWGRSRRESELESVKGRAGLLPPSLEWGGKATILERASQPWSMRSDGHAFFPLNIVWSESAFVARDAESTDRWYPRCHSIAGSENPEIHFGLRKAWPGHPRRQGQARTPRFHSVRCQKTAASYFASASYESYHNVLSQS